MSYCCHCFQLCNQPHIICNSCERPLHNKCTSLSDSELRVITSTKSTNLKLFCNQCKTTMSSLQQMKALISELQSSVERRLEKIEHLIGQNKLEPLHREELIQESVERTLRASNVIMYNVPENNGVRDVDIANDILECIDPTAVVVPEDVLRLGKPIPNKARPLRLRFTRIEMAKLVLQKQSALKNSKFSHVRLNNDKTRLQQEYYRNVQTEFKTRKENGETNIRLKFINNIPIITTINNNNSLN